MDSSDLVELIVGRLFPPGATVTRTLNDVPLADRYFLISGSKGPRWIVPWQARAGVGALSLWRPYRPASRLGWAGLMAAYRTGLLGSLPGVSAFGVVASAAWSHLGWENGPLTPTIYIGTPGPTRKAAAFLTSLGNSDPTRVAKIPLGPGAGRGILGEADILKRLAAEKPGLGPNVVFVDREGARAVQETVPGRPGRRDFSAAHLRWLVGLRRESAGTTLRAHAMTMADEVARVLAPAGQVDGILSRLARLDHSASLPSLWTHGDFAPWNLRSTKNGAMAAVDWEVSSQHGLPMYDLVHFHLIQDVLFQEHRLGGARYRRMARQYMGALGLDPDLHDQLLELALIKSWAVAAGEGDEARAAFAAECLGRL